MLRRLSVALLLLVCATALGGAPKPSPAIAQTPNTATTDVVRATYDNLLALFYRPLDPGALLNAGWAALSRNAQQSGLPTPSPLGSLPSDASAAYTSFSASYSAYTASLPPGSAATGLDFAIANGMTNSLNESHTHFLQPTEYQRFLEQLGSGDLPTGLGLQHTAGPPWIVTAVAPGSSAAQAGIQVGDTIVAVDGVDLQSANGQDFTRATGGADGTTHTITVDRGTGKLDMPVTRGPYYFPPISSRLLAGGIGYIAVNSFPDAGLTLPDGREFVSDFDRRLQELHDDGAQGLVLDLRDNRGGDTLAADEVLGRFLPPSTETVVRSDERGHQATGMVAGAMDPIQLPLVVLVNGDSASSAEVVASTLREAGRAILVGERTEGALSTSEVLPLPQNAGLQVAVASQVTAATGYKIDGHGYPVDIEASDTRTADDFRTGRDPQLDAAVTALAQAPQPPAAVSNTTVSKQEIHDLLAPYMPAASQIPGNDRLGAVVPTETLDLNDPNEWLNSFGFGGRDPYALQQTLKNRGWIGTEVQNYNTKALVPPTISVVIDIYSTPEGAEDALTTNDFPDQQEFVAAPVQLGDGTQATRGIWLGLGGISISWRRGNVVLNVGYGDVPGYDRMDTLASVATLVDQTYARSPLPPVSSILRPTPTTGAGGAAASSIAARQPAIQSETAAAPMRERYSSLITAGQTRSN